MRNLHSLPEYHALGVLVREAKTLRVLCMVSRILRNREINGYQKQRHSDELRARQARLVSTRRAIVQLRNNDTWHRGSSTS